MKQFQLTILLILLFLTSYCFAQKDVVGLFGMCDNDYSGYMCQQVLFNADSTFEFYDLLHLGGWSIIKGKWHFNGDTLILNSTEKPYSVIYAGKSQKDSIFLKLQGQNDSSGLAFASVQLNNDINRLMANRDGCVKAQRQNLVKVNVSYVGCYSCNVVLDKESVSVADTISIELICDQNVGFFDNVKWLYKKNKIFHTFNPNGKYDKERYFEKTDKQNLKYKSAK